MCGISGIIKKNNAKLTIDEFNKFKNCAELMNHRGPDNFQWYYDGQIGLLHQRLSIIDLDPRSNQPFTSKSGNYVCVYNGEIYNYLELKKLFNLETVTNSDTEIIIESYELFGEKIINQWNGIFAICIYDKTQKKLTLIRDRFGVKPLYIYENSEFFMFASEAKVIFEWLSHLEINYQALSEFIYQGSSISKNTIVNNVFKFDSGTFLIYDISENKKIVNKFWQIPGTKNEKYNFNDVIHKTKGLIELAVKSQLNSDVPLGVFLSGGLDSSAITALAATYYEGQLNTFTAEFDFNSNSKFEIQNARILSERYNTNHREIKIGAKGLHSIIEKLVYQHDEPFADPANIPLYLISKELNNSVKVVLQGDGADELFGGYSRYGMMKNRIALSNALRILQVLPLGNLRKNKINRVFSNLRIESEVKRIAAFSFTHEHNSTPWRFFSEEFKQNLSVVDPFEEFETIYRQFPDEDILQKMIYIDFNIELKNTYFEKVDKSTMINGVEARVPFMDNELCEYILSLPSGLKVNTLNRKKLLKEALSAYLPKEILSSPKRGFGVPISSWLRGGLKNFLIDELNNGVKMGILNNLEIQKLLNNHLINNRDNGILLWKLLVLIVWFKKYENKIIY